MYFNQVNGFNSHVQRCFEILKIYRKIAFVVWVQSNELDYIQCPRRESQNTYKPSTVCIWTYRSMDGTAMTKEKSDKNSIKKSLKNHGQSNPTLCEFLELTARKNTHMTSYIANINEKHTYILVVDPEISNRKPSSSLKQYRIFGVDFL